MRQYELARPSATRSAKAGIDGLNGVWESPQALPTSPSSSSRTTGSPRRTAVAAA